MSKSKCVSNHAFAEIACVGVSEGGFGIYVLNLIPGMQKLKQCRTTSGEDAACKIGAKFPKGHKRAAAGYRWAQH